MSKLVIHPKDRTTDFLKPIYHGRNDTTVITGDCTKTEVENAIDKHDHIIMLGHGTPQGLLAMNQFNGKPKPAYKPSHVVRNGGKTVVTNAEINDLYSSTSKVDGYTTGKRDDGIKAYSSYQGGFSEDHGYYGGNNGYVIDDMTTDKLAGKKLTSIWCNADQYMEWNELEGFYTGMFISDEGEAKMIGTADTDKWQVEESNYAFVSIVRRFLDQTPERLHAALMLEYGEMADRNAIAKYNLHRLYTRTNADNAAVRAI